MLAPGFETKFEEHACQERVHCGSAAILQEHELIHRNTTVATLLRLKCLFEDAELRHQLVQDHHFVEFDSAELVSHHSIEHLI